VDVFFDLDGTLTDSAPGIVRCLQHALVALQKSPPPAAALRRYIGTPLQDVFRELLDSTDTKHVDEAIRLYRERFATIGMFENSVYADVPDGLGQLRRDGHRLWVVTSKPTYYAQQIVAHFGLGDYFTGVYGSGLTGINTDKANLIADVLAREAIVASLACMIGDRHYDVQGARANLVAAVAVTWGYGDRDELRQAEPDCLAASMSDVCRYVAGRCREPHA